MNCDNCGKEITRAESRHISSSREYWLLIDNGGNIGDKNFGDNEVCWECERLAIRLIAKENKGLECKTSSKT